MMAASVDLDGNVLKPMKVARTAFMEDSVAGRHGCSKRGGGGQICAPRQSCRRGSLHRHEPRGRILIMVGVPALNVDSWPLGKKRELLENYPVDAESSPQVGRRTTRRTRRSLRGRHPWKTIVIAITTRHVCSTMTKWLIGHHPLSDPLSLLAFARSAPLARIPSSFPVRLPPGGTVHMWQACMDLTMAGGTTWAAVPLDEGLHYVGLALPCWPARWMHVLWKTRCGAS